MGYFFNPSLSSFRGKQRGIDRSRGFGSGRATGEFIGRNGGGDKGEGRVGGRKKKSMWIVEEKHDEAENNSEMRAGMPGRVGHKNEKLYLANGTFIL